MTAQKRQVLLWCCPFFVLFFLVVFVSWSGCATPLSVEGHLPYVIADADYPVYPDGFVIRVAVSHNDDGVCFRVYGSDNVEVNPGLRVEIIGDIADEGLRLWSYNCLPVDWKSGEIYTVKVYDGENLLRSIRYHFLATTE